MSQPAEIKMAFALCAAQDGKCFYCGVNFSGPTRNGSHSAGTQWTRDHLISVANGGEARRNLVLACARCNTVKSSANATKEQIEHAEKIWAKALNWGSAFYGRAVWWDNLSEPIAASVTQA